MNLKTYSLPVLIIISEDDLKKQIIAQACSQHICGLWMMSCVGPNLAGFDQDAYNCQNQGDYDINKCISGTQYAV